jgi:hypothetical protein
LFPWDLSRNQWLEPIWEAEWKIGASGEVLPVQTKNASETQQNEYL